MGVVGAGAGDAEGGSESKRESSPKMAIADLTESCLVGLAG